MIKYFDKGPFRGMWGYGRVFLKILWQGKLLRANIVTDDGTFNTSAYMIVIANASKYGTGAVINPEGLIHDGKFELVIVRKISLIEFVKMFIKNKAFNPKKVEIFQTTKAVITMKRAIHFQVDGEYKGKLNKVTAEIIPCALNLMIPG
jgi:diacylglycerol kinase family enzyme